MEIREEVRVWPSNWMIGYIDRSDPTMYKAYNWNGCYIGWYVVAQNITYKASTCRPYQYGEALKTLIYEDEDNQQFLNK